MATAQVTLAGAVAETRRASAGLWSDAWFRLRKDRVTMVAISVLLLLIVL